MNWLSLLLLLMFFLASCKPAGEPPRAKPGKLRVAAVNYPLAYFSERIGGDLVKVHFPKIEGDPAFWKPSRAAVKKFQQADVILFNGASYAKWRGTTSLPDSKTVDTSAGFRHLLLKVKVGVAHQHGKEGEHSHAGTAFTTWLDLKQAGQQAKAIRDALVKRLPDSQPILDENFSALNKELSEVEAELSEVAEKFGQTPLVGSHPVYQYLARGYDLNIISVHWEPSVMPDAAGWEALSNLRKKHPAKIMLWEEEPAKEIVEKLKELGVASVVFNPCGNRHRSLDWLAVMRTNISRLGAGPPKQ
jgi:zinc transport system substrate-binding protein